MKTETGFDMFGDRYKYDTRLGKEGFFQCDSAQDASYFGIWVHLDKLEFFSYVEGDTRRETCESLHEFVEAHSAMGFESETPPNSTSIFVGCVTPHQSNFLTQSNYITHTAN